MEIQETTRSHSKKEYLTLLTNMILIIANLVLKGPVLRILKNSVSCCNTRTLPKRNIKRQNSSSSKKLRKNINSLRMSPIILGSSHLDNFLIECQITTITTIPTNCLRITNKRIRIVISMIITGTFQGEILPMGKEKYPHLQMIEIHR